MASDDGESSSDDEADREYISSDSSDNTPPPKCKWSEKDPLLYLSLPTLINRSTFLREGVLG